MKIAFSKFAGLGSGGIEKYLQSIAMIMKDEGHQVDYYYTNAAPLLDTDWVHPPNDDLRKKVVSDYGINTIEVTVGHRIHNTWYDTDFFDKFEERNYDCLITAGNGEPEYPYTELKDIKIIHSVHGDHVHDQPNIIKSILICDWQADRWLKNGGNKNKLKLIPPVIKVPTSYPTNFREKHRIPEDAFVFGIHQRNDPTIFSPVCLEAFSNARLEDAYMVIMGGSKDHRNFVSELKKRDSIIFVDFCSDYLEIHNFLSSIDVYTHSRLDGEVCSASLIEAMYHGKPIVSCPGQNNGHQEQIQNCGFFCESLRDYIGAMERLSSEPSVYKESSRKTKIKYDEIYSFDSVKEKIIETVEEVVLTSI